MYLDVQSHRSSAAHPGTVTPSYPDPAASPSPGSHTSLPQWAFNPKLASLRQQLTDSAGVPDFADQVRGTEPKAIDMQLALISQDVYHADSQGIAGWQRLDDSQLMAAGIDPSSLEDPSTGFRAAIYQNADGDHVVAFAGSNDIKDWLDNVRQGIGLPASEYNQAVALATQAKATFGESVVITGHSLGGGLASLASLATDTPAVTFNASGLNDATLHRAVPEGDPSALKQQASEGLVRRYAVASEPLTGFQENSPAPDAVGHKIVLHDAAAVAKPDLHWYDWLDGKAEVLQSAYEAANAIHTIDLHNIGPVIEALNKDHPW